MAIFGWTVAAIFSFISTVASIVLTTDDEKGGAWLSLIGWIIITVICCYWLDASIRLAAN